MPEYRLDDGDLELGIAAGVVPAAVFALLVLFLGPWPTAAAFGAFILGWCAYTVGFGGAALARARW